jgi:hypothetical protein
MFKIQSDSKLLSAFPWPIKGNPDNNLESSYTTVAHAREKLGFADLNGRRTAGLKSIRKVRRQTNSIKVFSKLFLGPRENAADHIGCTI